MKLKKICNKLHGETHNQPKNIGIVQTYEWNVYKLQLNNRTRKTYQKNYTNFTTYVNFIYSINI